VLRPLVAVSEDDVIVGTEINTDLPEISNKLHSRVIEIMVKDKSAYSPEPDSKGLDIFRLLPAFIQFVFSFVSYTDYT
jgi:hypothetical protein